MDVFLHFFVLFALGGLVAAVAVLWRRTASTELRLRLLRERHDEVRKAARAFIGASRESPAEVCRKLDRSVRALVPQIDTVLFLERIGGDLACTYASGSRVEYFRGARLSLERDPSALTAAAIDCRRVSGPVSQGAIPGDRAFLAVPLIDAGHSTAVFYVASTSAAKLEPEEDVVMLVDLATPAYRVAVERESDRLRATIDGLTGLLTPRSFRAELASTVAAAAAQPEARISLLYIDTDNFKACNDTLGHAAGDAVLRGLARLFAASAGPEAIVARNGGDEFCILYPSLAKADAVRRAERIRRAVEAHPFARILGATLPRDITASIGVAAYPAEASTWEELLERADEAMYHSKKRGRNRVSFFGLAGNLVDLSDETAGLGPDASHGALRRDVD